MHDIFISYSTLDTDTALRVRNTLEAEGFVCWMAPRDIPGGSNYTKEIPSAIRECRIFLLVLSKNAQASHWVLKELDAAVTDQKTVLPLMVDDAPLNDEFGFLLSGAQRLHACPPDAEALRILSELVGAIIGKPSTPPAPGREDPPVLLPHREICCPACQGTQLKELSGIRRRDSSEWLTIWLVPVFGAVGFFLASLIGSIILVLASVSLSTFGFEWPVFLLIALATAGGCCLGDRIGKERIRRKRIRSHQDIHAYRCLKCAKKFQIDLLQK